jgi:hypothetical protein
MLLNKREACIHRLAVQIADDAARMDIETKCPSFTNEGREPETLEEIRAAWYDTTRAEDGAGESVLVAVVYLTLRDRVIRHPFRKGWMQIRDWALPAIRPPQLK